MNQIVADFRLRTIMPGPEGWGRKAAVPIQRALMTRLGSNVTAELVRISIMGINRMDVTFASAALVEPIRHFLGAKPICLIDLADQDLIDNIAAAAQRLAVPVTIWNREIVQVVGTVPSAANHAALDYALGRSEVRASDLAQVQRVSLTNASTRLKQLWAQGYLMREQGTQRSGGPEFVYRRIG